METGFRVQVPPGAEPREDEPSEVEETGEPEEEEQVCEAIAFDPESHVRPVDIVWAIDTSPSMAGERNAVQSNLNAFAQQIGNAEIDVNVVMIASPSNDGGLCIDAPLGSGNCPNDSNPPSYTHVHQWVGSHNALTRFVTEYPNYQSALRTDSIKYFAVVTDDDAEMSGQWFKDNLHALDSESFADWKMFGMFCQYRDSGGVYMGLVNDSGGLHVELCSASPNWQVVFDQMVDTVESDKQLACEWDVPEPPAGFVFEADKLNVDYAAGGTTVQRVLHVDGADACGAESGWYYDAASASERIAVCPATCDTIQGDTSGRIDVVFGCDTEYRDEE